MVKYILLLSLFLVACANDQSGNNLTLPGTTVSTNPTNGGSSGTGGSNNGGGSSNSGGSNSGSSPAPTGNNGGIVASQQCAATSAPTTTGGCVGFNGQFSTTIASNQKYEGLAAYANIYYMLLLQNDGGNIQHWIIYQNSLAGSGWIQVCSILDDGKFYGGLGIDGQYFYIGGSNALRRLNFSNCTETSPVSVSYSVINPPVFTVGASSAFFAHAEINYNIGYGVNVSTTSGGLISSFTSQTLAGHSSDWSYASALSYYAGGLWALMNTDSVTYVLWRFDTSGTPIGWSELYTSTGNDNLYGLSGLAIGSSGQALAMSNIYNSSVLKFTILDLTSF